MDGGATAAETAQRAEMLAAQVAADVEHYAVLRLATGILQESIESYRQKNEGTVIQRAGRLFQKLTVGSFDGLEIDVSGYKQGSNGYIDVSARAADKSAAAEAQQINSRVQGWDYEIPDYRYDEIFQSMDGLLKPLPAKKAHATPHAHPSKSK